MTYTYAILTVSKAAFDEILAKLKAAEYHYAFDEGDGVITIDMHGIGLRTET